MIRPSWAATRPAVRCSFQPQVEQLETRCLTTVGSFVTEPVIPIIDALTQAHMKEILTAGLFQGNRPNVFAKIGDSITESPAFLGPFGDPRYNELDPAVIGAHAELAATINFFGQQTVDATGANSFNRVSIAAHGGWGTLHVLNPASQPLLNELRATRPAFALIELGTNEVGFESNAEAFRARLTAVVRLVLSQGTIPVLSTIPDVLGPGGNPVQKVLLFNQVIAEVADAQNVPLLNYWLALQALPRKGLGPDGLHPNSFPLGSGILTEEGLRFGFNVRNLTALQVLDKLKRLVVENGIPDGSAPPSPEVVNYLEELYHLLLGRPPDEQGLRFFGNMLQQGVPRAAVVTALWESAEHRGRQVDEYYATYLHRAPEPTGRAFWVNSFLGRFTEEDVQRAILQSSEYLNSPTSPAAFAAVIVEDLFGPSFDVAAQSELEAILAGASNRTALVEGLFTSNARYEHLIDRYYADFLGRDADDAGLRFWVGFLRKGVSAEFVGLMLLASNEFWGIAQRP